MIPLGMKIWNPRGTREIFITPYSCTAANNRLTAYSARMQASYGIRAHFLSTVIKAHHRPGRDEH